MKRPSTSPSTNLMITAPLGTSPAKDRPRCAGRYTKQRSAPRFPASPDRPYYQQLAARIGGNRACLALARKLLKRSYHILKALGDQALTPVA